MPIDAHLTITDREFKVLRELIHRETGIALAEYKRTLVCSRLARRLRHHGLSTYADYYDLLTNADPEKRELREMINAITTNKTDFFREYHHFEFLAQHVFPAVAREHAPRLRLWSAGTATGEEAYSLAITVCEAFGLRLNECDIKILATDIDTQVLEHAESGLYTLDQIAPVAPNLQRRYFLRGVGMQEGKVMAKPVLRSLIRFRRLNLIETPWPMHGPFDVIFCRNVLIYFDKATRQCLLEHFAAMLKEGGYLMLGHSESIHGHGYDNLYTAIAHSSYRRRGSAAT